MYILIINIYIYTYFVHERKKHIKNWHWPCRSRVVQSTQPQLRWVPWGVDVFPGPANLCCTGPMERWAMGAMRCGASVNQPESWWMFDGFLMDFPLNFMSFPYTNHHKSMISCLLFSSACNTLVPRHMLTALSLAPLRWAHLNSLAEQQIYARCGGRGLKMRDPQVTMGWKYLQII